MEEAAVSIQAAFRGFCVRQCQPLRKLRRIADVRTKLKRLNMRASDPSYIDKLCSDRMENRKMKEEIMALLLELDTIQGVLPVVRNIRKSVTRDVVQFQEIVDAVKVDTAARNDVEEVNPLPSGHANSRASEQPVPRANVPLNPPLRRVMSLDDNVYAEQSYAHRANKKSPDGSAGDGSNRSSDDDAAPRGIAAGLVKNHFLQRSNSGNHRSLASKSSLLPRTFSDVQRNAGVRNPLLGRSISEVMRKPIKRNPLLSRSTSDVHRKKGDVMNSSPATKVSDVHRSPHPRTPPVAGVRVSSVDTNSPTARNEILFGREEAAIRIQSAFRGHMSRRSRPLQHLRNISVVNSRLGELNRQLAEPACTERLRMDEMERLKWSEEITALLLKLDSVQGVVQAIRDIRKSVTRAVMKLQEKVDNIIHEGDIMSRIADIQSDSSVATTEQENFGPEISDRESLDIDRGEQFIVSSPKISTSFDVIVGNGRAQAQHDAHLWDDKFMDLQKPLNVEQGCDGSTASCPCETAGTRTEGKQQPLVFSGEVDWQRPSLARTQKKLKRIEKERVQNGTVNGAVNPDLDSSAASLQDQLARSSSGDVEKPGEAVVYEITQAVQAPSKGITAAMGYFPQTSVYSTPVPRMRTSDEYSPSERQLGRDSNDVTMLPDEQFHLDREQEGCHNGRSPPLVLPCGHHPSEERACEFLRSRSGHCEEFSCGLCKVSNGQIAQDHLPTNSEAPAVHRPPEDEWEVDRLNSLLDENSRLKLLLSQVLEHAEGQARDLEVTKRRLAILEKERLQYTKKDDTGIRKKSTFGRRRR